MANRNNTDDGPAEKKPRGLKNYLRSAAAHYAEVQAQGGIKDRNPDSRRPGSGNQGFADADLKYFIGAFVKPESAVKNNVHKSDSADAKPEEKKPGNYFTRAVAYFRAVEKTGGRLDNNPDSARPGSGLDYYTGTKLKETVGALASFIVKPNKTAYEQYVQKITASRQDIDPVSTASAVSDFADPSISDASFDMGDLADYKPMQPGETAPGVAPVVAMPVQDTMPVNGLQNFLEASGDKTQPAIVKKLEKPAMALGAMVNGS